MKKISILLFLISFYGLANAQFQSDDEVVTAALNQKISQNLGRHHISLGVLGYFKAISGDFELPEYGIDASEGSGQFFNYRYSFDQNIDLAVDAHGWLETTEISGVRIETSAIGFGLGLRYTGNLGSRLFPYVQANVYSVTEALKVSALGITYNDDSDPAIGFGANVGAEIKLGRLISIPVDVFYMYGKPADDISGYGFATGISFNWGDIN